MPAARTRPRQGELFDPPPAPGLTVRNHGLNHSYKLDGTKVPGVSTISRLIKGDGLISYSGRQVAAAAVNRWDEFSELPVIDRLRALEATAWEERDAASQRGTQIHKLGALLSGGQEVTIPEPIEGYVRAYVRWLDEFEPKVIHTELGVGHRGERFAGRLDLIADLGPVILYGGEIIPAARWLIDLKSGKGIYGETAVQLTGYRYAEFWVDPDTKAERPMSELGIERTGVIHLGSDDCRLIEAYSGEAAWTYFRHLARLWWMAEDLKTWIGATAEPLGPGPAADF
jgi:hypothetical protein